jgi:hypothetical protein
LGEDYPTIECVFGVDSEVILSTAKRNNLCGRAAQASAQKVAAIETPLPEITVPKRRRKIAPVAAASKNGVTAEA